MRLDHQRCNIETINSKVDLINMTEITHMINRDGNVVIDASWDGNSYEVVLIPRFVGGIPHIQSSWIDTFGLDNPKDKKEEIITAIQTKRGKNKEASVVVEND